MKQVAVVSLGCAKNLVDTENMLGMINGEEYKITNEFDQAEVIIINTCGFIASAKEESINTILEMAQYKENGKCEVLIALGCLVQKYYEELAVEIPEVDVLLGTNSYGDILDVIREYYDNGEERIVRVKTEWSPAEAEKETTTKRVVTTPSHYAYVRIAEGCDNHCTYCVIPQMRGPYRSRKKEDIISEVEELVNKGVTEIIVVAQDTSYYGKDIYGHFALAELLKEIALVEGVVWIRLLYAYPNNFTDELIDVIATEPKMCKYLDIPLQHGDDHVLKRMGRKITQEEIETLINKLRAKCPEIVIRSSFIVGFPGETQEHFDNLVGFLEKVKLDRVGAFTYSQEEDTPAARLDGQIEEDVKESRQIQLMDAQYNVMFDKHEQYLGKEIMVKVDEIDETGLLICRSESEAPDVDPVIIVGSQDPYYPGQYLLVKITHLQDYDFIGEVVRELTKHIDLV